MPFSSSLLLIAVILPQAEPTVDYQKQIRPLLSNLCYKCHGPDSHERKGGLRLDTKDGALGEVESGGRAIVPGNLDKSLLVERINATDPDLVMPPPSLGKTLSGDQKKLLEQWIKEGADWKDHWAFLPPTRPEVPAVKGQEGLSPVDSFIRAKLAASGMTSAPEADRTTLIRRVTLDLTGLPPTPEEIDAFLADTSPDAYEHLVDRLLQSPRYGEHMAHYWLDAARYGDTHGLHLDNYRSMWPFRDWVINAFNENMPFDQFTIEQLAGDLLPTPTEDQRIASGFNRCNVTTSEGGSIDEEFYVRYTVDRVETTGTVWLGMSVGCAVCHDHKYDPLSQKEFYQLFAYFNNLTEKPMDGNAVDPPPTIRLATPEQQARLKELDAQIAELNEKLQQSLAGASDKETEWESQSTERLARKWHPIEFESMNSSGGSTLRRLDDGSILAEGENPAKDTYELTSVYEGEPITGIRLECLTHESMVANGPGRSHNSNFVLTEFEAEAVSVADPTLVRPVKFVAAFADFHQANGDYRIERAIDGDVGPESGWAIAGYERHENRTALFVPAEPIGFPGGTKLIVKLRHESQFAQHHIGRFRLSVCGHPDHADKGDVELTALLRVPADKRSDADKEAIRNYYRNEHVPGWRENNEALTQWQAEKKQLEGMFTPTLVMQEQEGMPREAFLLVRGEYDKKSDKVDRAVPAFLPPIPKDAPNNRLGLAKWLVDPSHPLTARVTVNRFWQQLFGVGIVKTSEDFGSQGEWPSHPELLDWLATEFVRTGWDVKRFVKMLVMTATYRQSSKITPEMEAADPENRLLARGPRFRLDAESIRDEALAVSGLMVEKIGGPSAKPYQPPGIWEAVAYPTSTTAKFERDSGEALYRRSLYTFWKRTAHPPALATFDAPSREACSVRRSRTNTPLQALVLMNDEQFIECARALGQRIITQGGSDDLARLKFGFRLVTSRWPTERELGILSETLGKQRDHFASNGDAAGKLITTGESKPDPSIPAEELATWTMMGSLLLNLDEAITKG